MPIDQPSYREDIPRANEVSKDLRTLRASIGIDERKLSQYQDFRQVVNPFPQNLTFELFSKYTSSKPIEQIGGNAICDFCRLGIDPAYVNRCFENERYLKTRLDGPKVIDLHRCGVIPESLSSLSSFVEPNSEWGRKLEFVGYPYVDSFVRFLCENPNAAVKVGSREVPLMTEGNRFYLYVALINAANRAKLDMRQMPWEMVIDGYQKTVDAYLERAKRPVDKVFLVGSADRAADGAYRHLDAFKYVYENTARSVTEFREGSGVPKDSIIPNIEAYMRDHPNEKVVVHIGLHGTAMGNTRYEDKAFSKTDIERLRQLTTKYDVTLLVDSCFGARKFFDAHPSGNVIMTSRSETASEFGYDRKFIEAYHFRAGSHTMRNGDLSGRGEVGFEEANLYALLTQNAGDMSIAFRSGGADLHLD